MYIFHNLKHWDISYIVADKALCGTMKYKQKSSHLMLWGLVYLWELNPMCTFSALENFEIALSPMRHID